MSVSAQVALDFDTSDVAQAINRLSDFDLATMAEHIGAMISRSTIDRLASEKQGPEGEPWPTWSIGYARTRHSGHSLLVGEGHMRDSIQHQIYGTRDDLVVSVGVHVKQAATHQFGDPSRGIPARPYLGLSADNRAAIEALIIGNLADLLE